MKLLSIAALLLLALGTNSLNLQPDSNELNSHEEEESQEENHQAGGGPLFRLSNFNSKYSWGRY